jgi:excisionase family DNA binding protein
MSQTSLPFADRFAISIPETCKALDVSRDTVYRMIADGRLVAVKLGRVTRVLLSSIHALLAASVVKPRPRAAPGGARRTTRAPEIAFLDDPTAEGVP